MLCWNELNTSFVKIIAFTKTPLMEHISQFISSNPLPKVGTHWSNAVAFDDVLKSEYLKYKNVIFPRTKRTFEEK